MKKLLIASTALSLAGGAAFAEMAITVSGDAKMGVDYASEPVADPMTGAVKSKHSFVHEIGIDFGASGTTDGGLTFGASAGFDVSDKAINTGTVNVSGSFGTLTIGGNDAADLTAGGTADVGLNDIGVDGMAEGLRGTTAAQLRYDNSFGQIKIAISAGTKAGKAMVKGRPAELSPEVKASEWIVVGPDGTTEHGFPVNYSRNESGEVTLKNEPMFGTSIDTGAAASGYVVTELDKVFGIVNRVQASDASAGLFQIDHDFDGATVDDADEGETAPINIFGFKREADGSITGPDGSAAGDDDDGSERDVMKGEANASRVRAFEIYEATHELGEDRSVGGVNPATGVTGDKNADTIKKGVIGDNGDPGGDIITPAVPDTPAVKSETEFAFGMSFEAGGVTIGVGYDSNKTVSMGAGFKAGEISTNLLYVKTEDDDETAADEEKSGLGVDMSYAMGASTVTLAYGRQKPETGDAMDAVGMGVAHDLGGGATMKAGFGKVDKMVGNEMVSENKASIGLSFKF